MKRSRFTESQILAVLKEADAGASVKDLCRRHGISAATFYQLHSAIGWVTPADKLAGREKAVWEQRDRHLEAARETRRQRRLCDCRPSCA